MVLFEVSKNTEGKKLRMAKTNKRKLILLSKCAVWDSKRLRFIKKGMLSNLRFKTPLS